MKKLVLTALAICLAACETAYYSAWEKVGVEKRDLLVDRIEDTRDAQQDAQEEFRDALEQYRSVVNFDGGDLEKQYNKLNSAYEDSKASADEIADRIRRVEDVADDLFDEWEKEAKQISNSRLRADSEQKLRDTRRRYRDMRDAMWRAEKKVHPVLTVLHDQVLYLKHNLNARAISALKSELATINQDVGQLIQQMQKSIDEANAFIANMEK